MGEGTNRLTRDGAYAAGAKTNAFDISSLRSTPFDTSVSEGGGADCILVIPLHTKGNTGGEYDLLVVAIWGDRLPIMRISLSSRC